ncbi:hypothetical protein D3C72_2541930 [compost metagenome]
MHEQRARVISHDHDADHVKRSLGHLALSLLVGDLLAQRQQQRHRGQRIGQRQHQRHSQADQLAQLDQFVGHEGSLR